MAKKHVIVDPSIVNFFNINLYKKSSSKLPLVKYFDLEAYTNQKNYKNFEIKCVKIYQEIFDLISKKEGSV